jgi:hypothetical protein
MAYSNHARLGQARELRAQMKEDGLTSNDAIVLQEIASCASRETLPPTGGLPQRIIGTTFVSEKEIAGRNLISQRTVASSIKRLQGTKVPYFTVVTVPGYRVNRYVLSPTLFPTAATPDAPSANTNYPKRTYSSTPNPTPAAAPAAHNRRRHNFGD